MRIESGLIESLNSFAGSGDRLFAETQLFSEDALDFPVGVLFFVQATIHGPR